MTTDRTYTDHELHGGFDAAMSTLSAMNDTDRARLRLSTDEAALAHDALAIGVECLEQEDFSTATRYLHMAHKHGIEEAHDLLAHCKDTPAGAAFDATLRAERIVSSAYIEADHIVQQAQDKAARLLQQTREEIAQFRKAVASVQPAAEGGNPTGDGQRRWPFEQDAGGGLRRRQPNRPLSRAIAGKVEHVADVLLAEPPLAPASVAGGEQATKGDLEQLVHAAAAGDVAARDRCFAIILPMVQRYCRARMGNRDIGSQSPADIAQEVCIAAFKALPRYQDNGGSFAHLVYAVAANKIADAYRAAGRDKSESTDELPELSMLSDGPESIAVAAELKVKMARLLATLPDVQREVLTMRIAVGLSANETAEALNLSPVHVRVIQHRALARLRAVMTADPEL